MMTSHLSLKDRIERRRSIMSATSRRGADRACRLARAVPGIRRRSAAPTPCSQTFPSILEGREIMMMNRRAFSAALVTGAAASLISTRGMAANSTPAKASNVVLVHGLFADGSCWSEVIARLQAAGLNATAVQNPLTTLPEAVASAQRVLATQAGPTGRVVHAFP